jgi:hypothetical protein
MLRLLAAFALLGCHHDPSPAAPIDKLPASSGTPIGYLVDDATELHLTADQLSKLKTIDTSLAADLDAIDARRRGAGQAKQEAPTTPPPATGRRGRHRHRGSPGPVTAASFNKAGGLDQQRAANVRDALKRAFEVLDADQQKAAAKLLADHNIDVDGREPAQTAAPGTDDDDPPPEP